MKSRELKRMEAEERQEVHNNLTLLEQLNKLDRRPGRCERERRRLYEKMNKVFGKESSL